MADTRIQLEVEDWVRRNWLPTHFGGAKFSRERLRLRSGGVFDFDAVSEDHMIVTTISTSGSKTSGGKHAVGKILKLRSDMFFLTMVEAQRRVIVLTEQDMCDQCEKESAGGRVPPEIDFVCAVIPDETQNTVGSGAIRKRRENTAFLVSDLTNQVSTSSPTICIAVNVGLGLDNLIVEITEARRCLSKSNEVVSRHASHQGERNVRDVISGSDGFSIQQLLQNTSRSSMHT